MAPSPQQQMEHIEKATQGAMKAFEEMNGMAREHFDAAIKSTAAVTKGMEEIVRNANGLLQESMTRAMSAGKTIADSKTMQQAMETHSEYMKDCFDCWMAGTGKISEISARMAQDAVAPITEHASNTISKIVERARAA